MSIEKQPKPIFQNLLNERPEGMSFEQYRRNQKAQKKALKVYKQQGRKNLLQMLKKGK